MSATDLSPVKAGEYLQDGVTAVSHTPAMHAEGTDIPQDQLRVDAGLALCAGLERDVIAMSPELGLNQERGLEAPALDDSAALSR